MREILDEPPVEICQCGVLDSLDVLLHLSVDLFTPLGKVGQSEMPLAVAILEHLIDSVKGLLRWHAVDAADGH